MRKGRDRVPNIGSQDQVEIPNKLYFRIGEVSRLTGVKPYVLRYWETEFPFLNPRRSGTGQRLYRRRDIEIILEIKNLVHQQRYTIEGARRLLATRYGRTRATFGQHPVVVSPVDRSPALEANPRSFELLRSIRNELEQLLKLLSEEPSSDPRT